MRVLLDENLPHDLSGALTGHVVFTVQGLGWAGTKNGALLKRAGDVCDVFISMDGNIEHQQVVPELLQAIDAVRPGEVRHVGKSSNRRGESGQAL